MKEKSSMANGKFFNDEVSYDAEFDPRFAPRFAEIATFLRAPHRLRLRGGGHRPPPRPPRPGPAAAGASPAPAGVPCGGGATTGAGPRHGPRAVRDLSSLMRA